MTSTEDSRGTELPANLDAWSGCMRDLQHYVQRKSIQRGFDMADPAAKMLLVTEEVGELAKAVRTLIGLHVATDSAQSAIAEEPVP